jgi:hypothetical protein
MGRVVQDPPQVGEGLAQVLAGGGIGNIGPQQSRQRVPAVGAGAAQGQVRQQRPDFAAFKAAQGSAIQAALQGSKYRDRKLSFQTCPQPVVFPDVFLTLSL